MGWGNPGERVESRSGRAPEHRNRYSSRISSQTQRATRPGGILIQVHPGIRVESRERSGCAHRLRYWTRQAGQGFRSLGEKTSAAPDPRVPGPGVSPPPPLHPPRGLSHPCREPRGRNKRRAPIPTSGLPLLSRVQELIRSHVCVMGKVLPGSALSPLFHGPMGKGPGKAREGRKRGGPGWPDRGKVQVGDRPAGGRRTTPLGGTRPPPNGHPFFNPQWLLPAIPPGVRG